MTGEQYWGKHSGPESLGSPEPPEDLGDDYVEAGPPEPPEVPELPEPPGRPRDQRRFRFFRELSDRTPLRTKLITAVLVLVVMAIAAISVASDVVLNSYLTTQGDPSVRNVFNTVQPSVADTPQHPAGSLYLLTGTNVYIGIQLPDAQLNQPSGGISSGYNSPQSTPLPNIPTDAAWTNANSGKLVTVGSQSGPDSWRVIVHSVTLTSATSGENEQATFVVAYDLGPINPEIQRLVTVEIIVGAAIIVVLAAAGVGVVRANLRPLDDIEMTAGQIARGHLNHRIPERDPRTEIGSLGQSLNSMLSQIETAFHAQEASEQAAHESEERMRRFIADASHELRTPLTTIRGFAEYYRQRGGSPRMHPDDSPSGNLTPGDLDRLMHRIEAEASRMGVLVEDLLELARLDQQRPLEFGPVDLLTVALDTVQDARIVASDRTIDLSVAPGAAFIVNGDEARLRQVIGNLVTNARTHTPPGTPIRVKVASGTLDSGAPAVVLDIEDDGPGMTPEQAQRVFERFYRADAARNHASGGTGLGLAIVAGLVAAHGGSVSVRTAPGQGADFQVRLPLSPDAQGLADDPVGDE